MSTKQLDAGHWASACMALGGLVAAAVGSLGHVVAGSRVLLVTNLLTIGLTWVAARARRRA